MPKAQGLFDDLDADIEAEHKANTRNESAPQSEKHAGGRPKSSVERVQFTTRPKTATRKALKAAAVELDLNASDIIDMLTERYLDVLLKEQSK